MPSRVSRPARHRGSAGRVSGHAEGCRARASMPAKGRCTPAARQSSGPRKAHQAGEHHRGDAAGSLRRGYPGGAERQDGQDPSSRGRSVERRIAQTAPAATSRWARSSSTRAVFGQGRAHGSVRAWCASPARGRCRSACSSAGRAVYWRTSRGRPGRSRLPQTFLGVVGHGRTRSSPSSSSVVRSRAGTP